MFAYPIVYDMVAVSEKEKKEVSSTLNSIISESLYYKCIAYTRIMTHS